MLEKLQKIISASGLMSRRAAETAIISGRVKVNGMLASIGDRADAEKDIISLDGAAINPHTNKLYIMLNKPKAYVTSLSDEKGRRNVTELLLGIKERVYPVGRLDMYSEGLLIFTNDGDFANRLMHPSSNIAKTYLTEVLGDDIEHSKMLLSKPMIIDGYKVSGAGVEQVDSFCGGARLLITIYEGRNRQIRKMCEKAGLRVKRLCRVKEGRLELGELESGKWRYLTEEEIESIRGE